MKRMTWNKKRMMGTTLAALTVVAGMSAVSFAGEPETIAATPIEMKAEMINIDSSNEGAMDFTNIEGLIKTINLTNKDGEINMTDVTGQDGVVKMTAITPDNGADASMISLEAKAVMTKVDEAGDTYWSFDDGETWSKASIEEGKDGTMVSSIEATRLTEAEVKE